MTSESIQETILDAWKSGRKTHKSPTGWISGNAVCCVYNGETQDKRGRGGMLSDSGGIAYACFNCRYSAKFVPGTPMSKKFTKLLGWLNFSESEINKIRLLNLSYLDSDITFQEPEIKTMTLPNQSHLLKDVQKDYPDHVAYIQSRGFDLNDYAFYVSDDRLNQMRSRVILPFYRNNQLVGYTARTIRDVVPKYHMQLNSAFVFGLELQKPECTWTMVTEGPFDALAVRGLGILGNEVSEPQANMINKLGKQIIVVPDLDQPGRYLVDDAVDQGWAVSFPTWPREVKDLNAAVLKYGRLFVTRHILNNVITNPLQIQIKKTLIYKNNKHN